jgi:protein PhnA
MKCELCSSEQNLSNYIVSENLSAQVCSTCISEIEKDTTVNSKHWFCLNESIWSENSAVKILAWRILYQLTSENWAQNLLDQIYLDDNDLAIAKSSLKEKSSDSNNNTVVKDSNGTRLLSGDSVTLIKDLDVKGANFTAKRGTLVKNIIVSEDLEHIEGKVNGVQIFLKTCFLKKAN